MILTVLAGVALVFAAVPAALYALNARRFRPPPVADGAMRQLSVLIPARNEESSIGAAVESVLASRGVELEVIVLDDLSADGTAEVVREMARKDSRVRLEHAPPLPAGWCGKQHACHVLAGIARHPLLTFLDADVRLEPDALARLAAFLEHSRAELVSGFPRQETGSFLEKLLIPLIHWLLLGYLPMGRMRRTRRPGYGAGCGQWFMATRAAYVAAGGHAAVRGSMHDGITLPRAFRRTGLRTDLCDATALARCRMYHTAPQVWLGLAKNAREGLGAPGLIAFTTAMLLCGHVLPFALLAFTPIMAAPDVALTLAAVLAAYYPRFDAAWRYRQSWLGAALHPAGVACLVIVQWYALARAWAGRPVGWKGRTVGGA